MGDLVERLRATAETQRQRRGDMMTYGEPDPWLVEAADEIARLREERRGLVEALRAVKDGARVGLPGRPVAKSKWASIPATTYHAVCAMIAAADDGGR